MGFAYPRWLGMGISEPSTVSRHTSTVSQEVVCDTLPDTLSVKLKRELAPFNEIVMATELILYQNPVVFVVRFILELSNVRSTTIGLTVTGRTLEKGCGALHGRYAFQQHGII